MSSIWTVRRSATDAKLAGLCSGVAEHWGVDPVLVRVAWVLLALSGGVGLVLYAAGWLLVPVEGKPTAPAHDLLGDSVRSWPKEVWVTLVVVACLAAFAVFNTLSPFGIGPAVLIAVVWYFGFYRPRAAANSTQPPAADPPAVLPTPPQFVHHPGPSTPFTQAAESWRARIEEHLRQVEYPGSAVGAVATATWPAPPTAPSSPTLPYPAETEPDPELADRSAFLAQPDPVGLYSPPAVDAALAPVRGADRLAARRLRLTSVAVLGLTLGGLGFADREGVSVPVAAYAATALLVVGLTLVVATWLGRARGLLPLGLLLVPVVVVTTAVGPVTHVDHWASSSAVYSATHLPSAAGDSLDAGNLRVDLRQLPTATDQTYTAHVGTGRLEVVVPADANVAVRYRVGVGVVETFGSEVAAGSGLTSDLPPTPLLSGEPTLTLDVSVERGRLEIHR